MNSHFPSHVHVIVSKYMRIDTHSHIPLSLCTKRIEVEWSYEDLWNWEVNIWIQEHLEQPQWLNLNMNRNNLVCSSSLVKSESTSRYIFVFYSYNISISKKSFDYLFRFFLLAVSCWRQIQYDNIALLLHLRLGAIPSPGPGDALSYPQIKAVSWRVEIKSVNYRHSAVQHNLRLRHSHVSFFDVLKIVNCPCSQPACSVRCWGQLDNHCVNVTMIIWHL